MFLLIPIEIWGLRIDVFQTNPNVSQPDKVDKYHSYLPGFMRNNLNLSIIVLILGIIFIVLAAKSIARVLTGLKAINIITIVVASLIILLQLFSIM